MSVAPLLTTLARVDAVQPWLGLRLGTSGSGWLRCEELLADPDAVADWQDRLRRALVARHRSQVPARTVEAFVRDAYVRIPAQPGGLCFGVDRRVPKLAPEHLAVRIEGTVVTGIALLDPRFACLPGDSAARHPDAEVVPDLAALARRLREEVQGHAARFFQVERRLARRGPHQLWGAAVDALDSAVADGSDAAAGPARALSDARTVLPGGIAPWPSASRTTLLAVAGGRRRISRVRVTCCFNDKLPGLEGRLCGNCPRLPHPAP